MGKIDLRESISPLRIQGQDFGKYRRKRGEIGASYSAQEGQILRALFYHFRVPVALIFCL